MLSAVQTSSTVLDFHFWIMTLLSLLTIKNLPLGGNPNPNPNLPLGNTLTSLLFQKLRLEKNIFPWWWSVLTIHEIIWLWMELDAKSIAMKIPIKNSLDQKMDLAPIPVLCPASSENFKTVLNLQNRQIRKQTNKIECLRLVLGIFSKMGYFLKSENQEELAIFFSFKIHLVMKKVLDNKCIPLASDLIGETLSWLLVD